jgi:tripartite-type tricarboxylate transporter receptor subunit TctC
MTRARVFVTGIVVAAVFLTVAPATAQVQAERPLRLIVPLAAGGTNDTIARLVSDKLAERLKQHIVVDNRPGANGQIGSTIVARAVPNGTTLLMIGAGHATNPALIKSLPYDTVRDFAPIGTVAGGPYLMVIPPSIPAKTAREFVTWVRSKPGQVSYASAGAGSPTHLAGELFRVTAGNLDMQHVPYKGGGVLMPDLIAGRVAMFMSSITTAQAHVSAGRLRPIAVTSTKRSPQVPDAPTFAEAGFPEVEVNAWYGMLTTGGTPRARVERLSLALQQVLADPTTRDLIQKQGLNAEPSTPEEFAKLIRTEMVKWAKVVKGAGIEPE